MLNGLDLFSGIGGITYALGDWVRPVAYCEIDEYARGVLLSRMSEGLLPIAPIWDDVQTLYGRMLPHIDIIYGGFPCQDVSLAGLRTGVEGKRTGLFREAIRLVRECRPQFVFLENVPGIRKYVPSVRFELEALGYDCRDGFLSAAEVGAPQIGNRWWLLAKASGKPGSFGVFDRDGQESQDGSKNQEVRSDDRIESEMGSQTNTGVRGNEEWLPEPQISRMVNGIPENVDAVKSLGNAVVPKQAREAFKILMGLDGA